MTTMADLVADVRTRLSGTFTDEMNTLGAEYTPGDTQITLSYDTLLTPGAIVSCGENTWYVLAVDQTNAKTVTIIPAYDGGPDLAKAAGSVVRLKPRFTDWSIFTQLRDQIMLMSSPSVGLGRFDFWMDYGLSTTNQYSPPDGVTPARIKAVYGSDGTRWWPVHGFQLQLGSVRVWDDRWVQYCFVYTEPFKEPTAFSDDIHTGLGLSEGMDDIPVLGAAGMLMLTQENRRNQLSAQGDARRSNEVQPGTNMGSGREMLRMRDQRIQQEYGRQINLAALQGQAG